jgi:hypothetical protein
MVEISPHSFPNRSVVLRGRRCNRRAPLCCSDTMPHFQKLPLFIQPARLYFRVEH